MLRLNSTNLEELEQEFIERATEVSVEIVKNICDALDADADEVNIAIVTQLNIDIKVNRQGYLEGLTSNLSRCAEAEEFELCHRAKEWIEALKDKN